MTELLPKPKLDDFVRPDGSLRAYEFQAAYHEYYKRLAEFAIEALERIAAVSDDDAAMRATNALSTIKGSQS